MPQTRPDPPSTLKRPGKALLDRWRVDPLFDDTIGLFLAKGFSLALCCRDCARIREWTPAELERRFGDRPGLRIDQLVPRLACAGDGGCGSRDIAVFPHYDERGWTWSPPDPAA